MKKTTSWGRIETVVWPPQAPIYTFMTFGASVFLTLALCWLYLRCCQTPMQQTYTVTYAQSSIGADFKQHGRYRLIYVAGGRLPSRLAVPLDFVQGETVLPNGRTVPVQLSEACLREGHTFFFNGAAKEFSDAALSGWLRELYFRQSLLSVYRTPLYAGVALLLLALPFSVGGDVRRFKGLKYGRRLKGPVMMTPKQFTESQKDEVPFRTRYDRLKNFPNRIPTLVLPMANQAMFESWRGFHQFRPLLPSIVRKPDTDEVHGIGFTTNEKDAVLRIPRRAEAKHMQIMGDTGAGKSTLINSFFSRSRTGTRLRSFTIRPVSSLSVSFAHSGVISF